MCLLVNLQIENRHSTILSTIFLPIVEVCFVASCGNANPINTPNIFLYPIELNTFVESPSRYKKYQVQAGNNYRQYNFPSFVSNCASV